VFEIETHSMRLYVNFFVMHWFLEDVVMKMDCQKEMRGAIPPIKGGQA